MSLDLSQTAQRLANAGKASEAVALLQSAIAAHDAVAAVELATWYLAGVVVARDLVAARLLLKRAVEIGHVDAALMEIALTANGSGGSANWTAAVRLLDHAASADPIAATYLALLCAMQIDAQGTPIGLPAPALLSARANIRLFSRFCTIDECLHIATVAAPMLQPATIFDPASNRMIAHPIRNSDNAAIGPTQETLPIQAINRRIAAATNTDVMQGEPLTVLRYQRSQQYRPHLDILPHGDNQRVTTAILYLNDGYEGGETQFAPLNLTITPRTGDLLVFDNLTDTGQPEFNSRHAGMSVINGVKWIATRWIRTRPTTAWAISDEARASASKS